MTNLIDLPPERDLPPARRQEIRAAVLHAGRQRRRPRTRLAVAVLAGAAVAASALVVGLSLPRVSDVPGGAPSVASPSPAPPTPAPSIPAAVATDLGPLSAKDVARVAAACEHDLARGSGRREVLFARRTLLGGDTVFFGGAGGTSLLCSDDTAEVYDGRTDQALPLASGDVVHQITGLSFGGDGRRSVVGIGYTVKPEVAGLQLRFKAGGRFGPWYAATISNGYAYASAAADGAISRGGLGYQVRVLDSTGHVLMSEGIGG